MATRRRRVSGGGGSSGSAGSDTAARLCHRDDRLRSAGILMFFHGVRQRVCGPQGYAPNSAWVEFRWRSPRILWLNTADSDCQQFYAYPRRASFFVAKDQEGFRHWWGDHDDSGNSLVTGQIMWRGVSLLRLGHFSQRILASSFFYVFTGAHGIASCWEECWRCSTSQFRHTAKA